MSGRKRKRTPKKTPERKPHTRNERNKRRLQREERKVEREAQKTLETRRTMAQSYRRLIGNRDISYDLGTPEAPSRDYPVFESVLSNPRVIRELEANPNLVPRIRELVQPRIDTLRIQRLTSNPNMDYESEINTIIDQSIRTARDETVGPNQGMSKNNNGQGAKRRKSKSKRKPPKKTKGKTKGKRKGKRKGKKGKRSMRRKKSNHRKSKKR